MAILICIVFSMITVVELVAQSGWNLQQSGTSENLNSVFFTNILTGWVVGSNGIILKTSNGGQTWLTQNSGTQLDLSAVYFANNQTGWAAGYPGGPPYDSGVILRTTNSGTQWLLQSFSDGFFGIDFLDILTGWVAGWAGAIMKTTNGGISWFVQNSGTSNAFRDVDFVNENTGWAVGGYYSNLVRKTTDGGSIWFQQNTGFNESFWDVHALDNQRVWAADVSGYVARTANGGSTWTRQWVGFNPSSIFMISSLTGWAGGGYYIYESRISQTTNGGQSYDSQYVPTNNQINKIFFVNYTVGWAVGVLGTILYTNNGGAMGIEPLTNGIPSRFGLCQNYPNPFNPVTKIKFDIPLLRGVSAGRGVSVRLSIFDILGREITTLVNEPLSPGIYEVTWDGSKYASGVYFYKLSTNEFSETKMI